MSLIGKVISIEGDWVTVEVNPLSRCEGCHACGGLLVGKEGTRPRYLSALKQGLDLELGDLVTLDTRPGEVSIAAFLIFGLPLVGFFIGLLLFPSFFGKYTNPTADWQYALGGMLGLCISSTLLFIINRAGLLRKFSLKVTGKIRSEITPNENCSLKQ